MNRIFLIILLSASIPASLWSQDEIPMTKFKDTARYEEIPGTYLDHDAVLLFEKRRMDLGYSFLTVTSTIQTHSKLKILTKNGLVNYARITIEKNGWSKLLRLAVRTIKKNGQSIDLESKDVKQMDLAADDLYRENDYLRFAIPGVEVEDEIEIFTSYEIPTQTSGELYLNSYLPCIHSEMELFNPGNLDIDLKLFNGMPKPTKTGTTWILCNWTMDNVPTYSDQNYSIISKEQPYVRYAIRKVITSAKDIPVLQNDWSAYIDDIFSITETTKKKTKTFKPAIEKKFGVLDPNAIPAAKLKYLVNIHHFINDSVKVDWLNNEESNKQLSYFINSGKIDPQNLLLFYDNLFSYLNVNYFIGYGRDKYQGDFDPSFVGPHLITNSFISFELDNFYYFLFLKNYTNSYELGEIPVELQGTNTVLISKRQIPERVKQATLITTEKQNNYRRVKNTVNIALDKQKVSGTVKRQYAGSVATFKKPDYKNYSTAEVLDGLNKYNRFVKSRVTIDSVAFDFRDSYKFPYAFNVNYNYHMDEAGISQLEKNLFAISLTGWFDHAVIKSTSNKRIADLYSDFLYADNMKFYLVFDKKVEITNKSAIETSLNNEFGSYFLTIKQINPTMLVIESNYEISQTKLAKENYWMIGELEKQNEKANTSQLVIRVLE